jgi:hypothetical protein
MIPLTKGKRIVFAVFSLALANFGVRGISPGRFGYFGAAKYL